MAKPKGYWLVFFKFSREAKYRDYPAICESLTAVKEFMGNMRSEVDSFRVTRVTGLQLVESDGGQGARKIFEQT